MKACLKTTSMFCSGEKSIGLKEIQQNDKSTQVYTIKTKHLTDLGQMWPKYLPLATLANNTFNICRTANYSPMN